MRILWLFLIISSIAFSSNSYADGSISEMQDKSYTPEDKYKNISPYLPSLGYMNTIDDAKNSNKKANEWEIADLVAQIGMNRSAQTMTAASQEMATDTNSMKWATWVAAFFLAITLIYTIRTFMEAQRINIIQLQPWVNIGEPTVSYRGGLVNWPADDSDESLPKNLFSIEIPITNEGKTPIESLQIMPTKVDIVSNDIIVDDRFNVSLDLEKTKWWVFPNPINPEVLKKFIVIPIFITKYEGEYIMDGIGDTDYTFTIDFHVRFTDSFTGEKDARFISVKTRKYTCWERDEVVTDVEFTNPTLESKVKKSEKCDNR